MKKLVALAFAVVVAVAGYAAHPSQNGAPVAFADSYGITAPPSATEAPSEYHSYTGLAFKGERCVTMAAGKARKLELVGDAGIVEWQSSNPLVASVNGEGAVSARRAGAAVITARNPVTGRAAVCTVKVFKKCTQKQARKAILSMKKTHYQGRRWTNDEYYYWQAGNARCYGCIAFVAQASDKAFGKFAPLKRHARFSRIKVGDHVRIGGKHSVIVLHKKKKSIVVAEGNYNGSLHWNRKISRSALKRQGFYVETRY